MTDAGDGAGSPGDAGQGAADASANAAANAPRLSVTAQYVKDFSFENPNAPQSLAPPKEQPQIDVNVEVEANLLAPDTYEVTLRITVTARNLETTLFVIELLYAGLFRIENIPEESLEAVCLIECPRLIFPFARRIIADGTRDGGFPPMLIDPIDFATLYRQRAQASKEASPVDADA
ncbi:MAG: protein-export chaperone SecB [Alphaproteobacteria bacterium]|nr:protein-export chaperone SecB [Alphaproteobacteria bacterium]